MSTDTPRTSPYPANPVDPANGTGQGLRVTRQSRTPPSRRTPAARRTPSTALVAGLVGIAGLAACGESAPAPAADTVGIALAAPVSTPAYRGVQLAAEMAVDSINAAGGIAGRPVELLVRDDSTSPELAITIASELVADPRVVAAVGHVNSAATLAAAQVYNDPRHALVNVSPASSAPAISEAGLWTFRVTPTDLLHGPALARWAYNRLDARRATVLYSNDEYGRGLRTSFADAFTSLGGRVLHTDPYLPSLLQEDPDATAPFLERAVRDRTDVLVIAGQTADGELVLRTARAEGYRGPVMGADGLAGLRDVGPVASGVFVSSAWLPDGPADATQAFVDAFRARYDVVPDQFAAMTYDAVRLLAEAADAVGPDREAIREYLDGVGEDGSAFPGVTGDIAFDENGDVPDKDVVVGVIRDGRLVTAGG